MTITAKLFGGMYDGEVVPCASFMPYIEKPIPPDPDNMVGALDEASIVPDGPARLVYRYVGQHPQDGTLMYVWREKDGDVRR
jgi:hypothetical protein